MDQLTEQQIRTATERANILHRIWETAKEYSGRAFVVGALAIPSAAFVAAEASAEASLPQGGTPLIEDGTHICNASDQGKTPVSYESQPGPNGLILEVAYCSNTTPQSSSVEEVTDVSEATPPASNGQSQQGEGQQTGNQTGAPNGNIVPKEPTFEEVLAYVQCGSGLGDANEAALLRSLKTAEGSERLAVLVEQCPVQFVGDVILELGRPLTNIEQVLSLAYLNITPDTPQTAELDSYLTKLYQQQQQAAVFATSTTTTMPNTTDASVSDSTFTPAIAVSELPDGETSEVTEPNPNTEVASTTGLAANANSVTSDSANVAPMTTAELTNEPSSDSAETVLGALLATSAVIGLTFAVRSIHRHGTPRPANP